ncbi:MAG: hypothetical protein KatS3mg085_264 [Candidatus Dojkabacteria bacterium]|nr:MAG: hypothetical protein KatS3mg085_264 [Candidatus Dojkabacteria bacterium]
MYNISNLAKKHKFNLIYGVSLFIAFSASILLGVNIENQTPKVLELFQINGDIDNAEIENQKLVFKTNRLIDKNTLNAIKVEPAAKFGVTSYENKLNINFTEPLKSNQVYAITFGEGLLDVYGNSFEEKSFEFKTKKLQLAFMDLDRKKIKKTDVELTNFETLFESEYEIKRFIARDAGLIVQAESGIGSSIFLVSENNKIKVELNQKLVNAITASDNFEKVFFVAGDANFIDGQIYPTGLNSLYELDFKTGIYREVPLEKSVFWEVVDAQIVPDGSAILIKNFESNFFLVSTSNYSDYINLGKYLDVTDFNQVAKKYLAVESPFGASFANFPYITIIDSNSNKTAITDGDVYVLDPKFWGADSIVYSSRVAETDYSRGLFGISILNLQNNEIKELIKINDKSVELPIVSPDLRYIAVEIYNKDDLNSFEGLRNKGFQSKPGIAEIGIIDMENNLLISKGVEGIEAQWM